MVCSSFSHSFSIKMACQRSGGCLGAAKPGLMKGPQTEPTGALSIVFSLKTSIESEKGRKKKGQQTFWTCAKKEQEVAFILPCLITAESTRRKEKVREKVEQQSKDDHLKFPLSTDYFYQLVGNCQLLLEINLLLCSEHT